MELLNPGPSDSLKKLNDRLPHPGFTQGTQTLFVYGCTVAACSEVMTPGAERMARSYAM